MAEFVAMSRVPTRPLSYENVDMAVPKELIIDYTNANIYVKDTNGIVHDITGSIATEISNQIKQDPSIIIDSIKIPITDPDSGEITQIAIDQALIRTITRVTNLESSIEQLTPDVNTLKSTVEEHSNDINNIKTNLSTVTQNLEETDKTVTALKNAMVKNDESGNPIVEVNPTDIKTDESHQFVTQEQLGKIDQIDNKVEVSYKKVTVPISSWTGEAAPYSASIVAAWATATMNPPIMDLICSSYYETAKKEIEGYQIYRAATSDGSITLYNNEKPEVDLTLLFELKIPVVPIS